MHIESLNLINYRSFENLSISFHDKLTVIVGGNGVGKTSIIESLAIACGTFFLGLDNVKSASIKPTDSRYLYYNIGSGLQVSVVLRIRIRLFPIIHIRNIRILFRG